MRIGTDANRQVEKDLAAAHLTRTQRRDPELTYNKTTLEVRQKRFLHRVRDRMCDRKCDDRVFTTFSTAWSAAIVCIYYWDQCSCISLQ